jgi:hypothetical protein
VANKGALIVIQKLQTTTDPFDQLYVLEILSNLSEARSPDFHIPELEKILIPFLDSPDEILVNATHTILNNLRMYFL